ncbi:MAG: hypothetical protein IIY85_04535 [Lachnospiraceae bacterium]|jgi:hypothetical protein|nr:hypothetical protein [Lachnospiraceae bacterium]
MYNEARMFGVATGVAVGLVLALIIVRTVNRDRKLRTEYDEMQKLARGQAYKYAFYAVMIYEALVCWLSMGIELPAEQSVIHFFGIFVGITVQACYCIWKDAYIGLNTNLKRYIILVTVASVLNLLAAFMAWKAGELFVDGKFQLQTINLLCGLMFAAIGAVGLAKKLADREEDA